MYTKKSARRRKHKKEAFDFLIIKKHHCAETKEVKNRKREKEEREKSIIYNYCNENILEKKPKPM